MNWLDSFLNKTRKARETKEKAKRLAAQWPKRHKHAHGGGECLFSKEDWAKLEYASTQSDAYCTLESRHCHCGSTLAIMTEIHDLSQE
jgi:hypothetical protein